jgi:hypothetical protein
MLHLHRNVDYVQNYVAFVSLYANFPKNEICGKNETIL